MAAAMGIPSYYQNRFQFLTGVVIMAGIFLLLSGEGVQAADCEGDIQSLAQFCAQYVGISGPQIPPSQACCNVVRRCNIPCVCSHLNRGEGSMVSGSKVAYVARYCGRPLPAGTKCGSMATITTQA